MSRSKQSTLNRTSIQRGRDSSKAFLVCMFTLRGSKHRLSAECLPVVCVVSCCVLQSICQAWVRLLQELEYYLTKLAYMLSFAITLFMIQGFAKYIL